MPDWRVGEFEGTFKDEFPQNKNSEHENGIGARGITSSKKLKYAVGSEKSPKGGISGANNSGSSKCNSENIQSASGVTSQDINSITDGIGDCIDGSNAFPLGEENATTETRCGTDNWNACQFSLSNGSSIVNNQSAAQGSLTYGDNDLNYIDWPGIDNFEDIDTLFRTCDSTYGQQQLENTNELSWIPPSDAIYSSDVALQQGFDSYSDYGILDDLSAFNCAADKSLSSADPSAAFCEKQFNDNYLFSEQNNLSSYSEQAYQEDAMEMLPTDQICGGHGDIDMVGSQYSSENPIQGIEDQKFSMASASQLSSSQNLLKQNHQLDSSSPSNITSESYPERNSQFNSSGSSFVQRKVPKKAVKVHPGQPISDNVVNGHPQALTRRASYPCESYGTDKKGLGKRTLENPRVPVGSSMVVDGSLVSSVSSENSVEESSFRQLQDAVSQLDIQTKLCIRDGLYRLARSAQNRQVFPNVVNSGDSQDVQNAESSNKFADPRSIETQTNPIDRSIALLLFHQSSNEVTGAADDTSSLKSHKKQHQDPAKTQDMVPAPSIYSPRGQGGSLDAKSRANC